jgi:hypothetical protein
MPEGKEDAATVLVTSTVSLATSEIIEVSSASSRPAATSEIIEALSTSPGPPAGDPWRIMDYEIWMLRELTRWLRRLRVEASPSVSDVVKNALVESFLLRVRNLCEVFLPDEGKKCDDLRLSHLFTDWESDERYAAIKKTIDGLRAAYGRSSDKTSPRWNLNKRVAHPTLVRGESPGYNHAPHLKTLLPLLWDVTTQIEILKKARGSK